MSINCQRTYSLTVLGAITLSSSENPSLMCDSVTYTATIPGLTSGTITFFDGSTQIGTSAISTGIAMLTVNPSTIGTHSITAQYLTVTSNTVHQVVNVNPSASLQLDGGTVAIMNGIMDFVQACSGIPAHHLTGLMAHTIDGNWLENNGFGSSLLVAASMSGIGVTIDFVSNQYTNTGILSPFPAGTITSWVGGGSVITVCGPIPNIPPPIGGTVSYSCG